MVVVDVAEGGVEGSVAKEVELGDGWGRPMERAGKWVEEAMRKARPSPEGQEGEERMEKEKREEKETVELIWGWKEQRVKKVIIKDIGEGFGVQGEAPKYWGFLPPPPIASPIPQNVF